MALVQYGSIITEIKGKIGGSTFQSCRGGFMLKNKGRNPQSGTGLNWRSAGGIIDYGEAHRLAFVSTTKNWSKLTDAERATWSSLVGVWQFINKFGNVYNGSPYQIFTACNINRATLGLPQLNVAPIFNPAIEIDYVFTDYSIAGNFDASYTNAAAQGQYVFIQVYWFDNKAKSFGKQRIAGSQVHLLAAPGSTNFKPLIQSFFGGNPPLNTSFYVQLWNAWADYPKKQFVSLHKINVVA